MAGAPAPLLRLLPLLLLLLPRGLREHLSPETSAPGAAADEEEVIRHPIVLIPGLRCCMLEARLTESYHPSTPRCGAMKGKGWFGLWTNSTDLVTHNYVPCFMEQMRLVYDPDADDYRNLPGVETRVPNFGSSRGFKWEPDNTQCCLRVLRQELERVGYRDGETLFGAPYDLRHAPVRTSRAYSLYFQQLTSLVEDASKRNQGRKVILCGHSFGGTVALDFVRSTTTAWRDKHIKHLFLAAPIPEAGTVPTAKFMASGPETLSVPSTTPMSLRPMWRTFESAIVNFPSPAVYGPNRSIVITRERNYSAHDMADFLVAAFGSGDNGVVEAFKRREVTTMDGFQAPMVPTTCINGVGNDTPEQLVYWDGDFDADPEMVSGDGDGMVNLISMLAFDEQMRRHPAQSKMFKSIKLVGLKHSEIVIVDWALKRVMQEILEANRIPTI